MTKEISRREILKASAYAGSFGGITVSQTSDRAIARSNEGPSADSHPGQFRIINNGFKRAETIVRVRRLSDETLLKRYELRTTGTNHPEMKGKSHDERFPHVAADIDSFGNLPPGSYKLEVEHGELYEETTFTFGESGIPDGDKIHAKVLPNNELTIRTTHLDPSHPIK